MSLLLLSLLLAVMKLQEEIGEVVSPVDFACDDASAQRESGRVRMEAAEGCALPAPAIALAALEQSWSTPCSD